MEEQRALPHSLEAERAVLGGLMMESINPGDIAEILDPSDFYRDSHGQLYALLLEMAEKGQPTEIVAVVERIMTTNRGEELGGLSYITSLPDNIPSTENIAYYAGIVRERAIVRRLLSGLTDVAERARSGTDELPELLDFAESTIFKVTQEKSNTDWQVISQVVDQEFMRIQQLSERSGEVTGISTGFVDLDKMLAGLQRTDLLILAARPAMGKCLSADSRVVMADGSRRRMADLVAAQDGSLLTLDEGLQLQWTRPSAYIDDGKKPVFSVRTRLGRRVETTLTHPFLTVQGWKPLGELKPGMHIAVPKVLPVFGEQPLGDGRAHDLGAAVGSWIGHASTDGVVEGLRRALGVITGLLSTQPQPPPQDVLMPLMTAPKGEVATALRALFVAAGARLTVSSKGLQLKVGNPDLAGDLQHLLLRFGIVAALRDVSSEAVLTVNTVSSLQKMLVDIGLPVFQEEIRQLCHHRSAEGPLETLPGTVWACIDAALQNGSALPMALQGLQHGMPLTHQQVAAAGEVLGDAWLMAIAQGDVLWDEIEDISFVGLGQVYDLTVPETHNFIAEDICVHNTALALNLGLNAARTGVGVGMFSLEMSAGQLVTRLLCAEGRVDAGKVRTGFLSRDHDWPNLTKAAESLYHMPVYIDDTPGLNITQLRSKARRLKSQCPELGVLIIDYIGLMSGDGRVSRQEQIAQASRGMKALAKELDICVLCLSQLNRAVEQRNPKIPQIADLRESGAIEQDADIIMFIYREEYYNPESPRQGEADVIIAKQRNGPTGTVTLHFEGRHTRFDNLARQYSDDGYV